MLKMILVNGIIAAIVGTTFSWYASYIMIREMLTAKKLEDERSKFKEQSIKDELTGLSNRRDFLNSANFYTSVCQHVHQTIGVIMMDVDHFKNYNDVYGHAQGDLVLKAIGDVLKNLVQEEKVFAARVGGEEFIILWTENRLSEAEGLALKLKKTINALNIPHSKSDAALHVTASYGLYFLRGGSMDTVDEFYEKADAALYEAKKQGRNRIILVDSYEPSVFRLVE
jgi:diguanylate cyclase (GGDEF)-like protein